MMHHRMNIKKRFIAGAVCSQCHAIDRTVQYISPDDEWISCVECGYTERRPTVESMSVVQPAADNAEQSVVKFLNKPL